MVVKKTAHCNVHLSISLINCAQTSNRFLWCFTRDSLLWIMVSGLCSRQLSHSRLYVSQTHRNSNLDGEIYKGKSKLWAFFFSIQEKWTKWGTDEKGRWETDVDLDLLCLMFLFLRGLLNCLCKAVGRPEHTTLSLPTLYLPTFNIQVGISYFPSAHLSTAVFFLSASAPINYTQLHFIV